jgi:hypothetical protein
MNVAPSLEQSAAADPRIAVAEARLVMLRDVAEFGMSRLRTRYARPGEDPAIACMRLSRAVRCALILEGRIEVELASLKVGTWMPTAASPSPDLADDHEPSKAEDMSALKDPIERESPDRETFGHILKLPFKDAVSAILTDLGFNPRLTGEALPPPDPPPRISRSA